MKNTAFVFLCIIVVSTIKTMYGGYQHWGGRQYYKSCRILRRFLVTRFGWNAQDAWGDPERLSKPADLVIIHETVTQLCLAFQTCAKAMKTLQEDHMNDKKWLDIGYHFVIGGDGRVYKGRRWNEVGVHTKHHNKNSIGIALIGDFQTETPSTQMLDLVQFIAYCGVKKGYVSKKFNIIGHRDARCIECPGDALYNIIQKWSRYPETVPIPTYTCDPTTQAPTEYLQLDLSPRNLEITNQSTYNHSYDEMPEPATIVYNTTELFPSGN